MIPIRYYFFSWKGILEITSFDSIIYPCIPPSNRQTYINPGETDIVKFIIFPPRLPLKMIPLAISVSMNKTLKDIMSTGLVDKLFSSYSVLALDPKRYRILLSNSKLIIGSHG